ncbi:MAG: flagellar basal body P-ring formation chaperone FlgA [Desulfurobacteriaceae bacterium]
MLVLACYSFAAVVELKDRAVVSGKDVLLSDIAVISGNGAEGLRYIKVSSSPPPCREKRLSKSEVVSRITVFLKRRGGDFDKVEVRGAETVTVWRKCLKVDKEHVESLVKAYLRKHYPDLTVVRVPFYAFNVPSGEFEERLDLDSISKKYAYFEYVVSVNGKVYKRVRLPVRIEKLVKAVVSRVPIPKGAVITADMIRLKEIPSSKSRGTFGKPEFVIGGKARRKISAGTIIRERDIEPNFAVKKGMPVKVVYRSGAIRIELLGVSLENGFVGNIIRVKNISTGKVLLCRVTGNGVVEFVSR